MDLTESIASKSDQLDYQDFLGGPRTVTITEVRGGPSAEQPVEIVVAEYERPWRPAKSMRRVLVSAWGADGKQYTGRRITLFGDPTVKWGGIAVGGIRLSHLSHIEKRLTVSLTETRGKRKPFTVDPLVEAPTPVARDWDLEIDSRIGNETALRALWEEAQKAGEHPHLLERIRAAAMAPAASTPEAVA